MPGRCGDGDVGGRRVLVRRRERGRQPQQRGARPPPGNYTSQQPPRGARHTGTCSPCPLKAAGQFAASVAPGAGGVLMRGPGAEPGLAAALERYQRRLRGERGWRGVAGGPERFPWLHGSLPAPPDPSGAARQEPLKEATVGSSSVTTAWLRAPSPFAAPVRAGGPWVTLLCRRGLFLAVEKR